MREAIDILDDEPIIGVMVAIMQSHYGVRLMLHVDIGKQLAFDISDENMAALLSHEAVKSHVLYIGLRNILMDSHASCKRETYGDDEITWRNNSKAMAEKKLAAMLAGEIRSNSSGPRVSSLSPIDAEARRLARVAVYAHAKAKGVTDKEKIAVAIAKYAAKPETIATATANVAAAKALVTDDIDL